jgi:hypothetical protein
MAKEITLSEEQLYRMVAEATKAGVEAARPKPPDPFNADEALAKVQASLKPPGKPERHVQAKSEESGATFTLIIAPSRTDPAGRVMDLRDYAYPPDILDRVPEGLAKRRKDKATGIEIETQEFKVWRWKNFYQLDLIRYVGRLASDPVVTRCFLPVAAE